MALQVIRHLDRSISILTAGRTILHTMGIGKTAGFSHGLKIYSGELPNESGNVGLRTGALNFQRAIASPPSARLIRQGNFPTHSSRQPDSARMNISDRCSH